MLIMPRMNPFDELDCSSWYKYSLTDSFAAKCSKPSVIDLLVELFSVGSKPGSPEHTAVRACVTRGDIRIFICSMIAWPGKHPVEMRLGWQCCQAYCELVENYPSGVWKDAVFHSDARKRLILLCNSFTTFFLQRWIPDGTQPDQTIDDLGEL